MQGEKKKTYQELLSNKEELQRKLSYYTTLEEGTQYSKAVNDNVKTFLFTYDQAEEKTKEQMKLQELDLKNKKVYNTMRKNWKLKLLTEYNYEQIADVYKAMLNDKNRVLEERAKLLTPVSYTHLTLPTIYSV